jgi:transposase-like protein
MGSGEAGGQRADAAGDARSRLSLVEAECVRVPVDAIGEADSPRLLGVDMAHAGYLAQLEGGLPPVVVDRATMRVIDGMHRLAAARLNGRRDIEVSFFDGDAGDAFLEAVRLNVSHGLPLSLADRRAAAARVICTHPHLSDRSIARTTGLAAKTVASLRRTAPGAAAGAAPAARTGLDGRVRPVDPAAGRQAAASLLAARPGATLREIARAAGISAETARSVRERARQGQDPVADRRSAPARARPAPARAVTLKVPASGLSHELRSLLANLRRDPSLRYTDAGRAVLTWLAPRVLLPDELPAELHSIPPHARAAISALARTTATAWIQTALKLEDNPQPHTTQADNAQQENLNGDEGARNRLRRQ